MKKYVFNILSHLSSPYNLGWDLHTGWQGRLSMWSQLRIIDNWSVITGFCLLFMIEKSNGCDCDSLKMEISTVAWICWLEAYTAEHLEGFQVKSEEKETRRKNYLYCPASREDKKTRSNRLEFFFTCTAQHPPRTVAWWREQWLRLLVAPQSKPCKPGQTWVYLKPKHENMKSSKETFTDLSKKVNYVFQKHLCLVGAR